LIIWDEVSMQHRHCLEVVDHTLRDLCNNDMTIVFGGEFQKILWVFVKGSRAQIVVALLQRTML